MGKSWRSIMWKILGNDFGSFMSIKCSFHCDFFFFWGGSISVLLINLNSDNLVTFLFYFFILLYDFAIFCFQLSFSSELSICTLLFKFGFCVCVCVFSYTYDYKIFSFVKFTFSPKSCLIINFYRFTCCGDNVYWLFGWICCIQSVI